MNAAKMKTSATGAAGLLKGLANPHRLLILCHLAEGEKSVGVLERLLGMRQPHLSQHLARLRRDALVGTRRDSRTIYYRLNNSAAAKVIRLLYRLYCAQRVVGNRAIAHGQARRAGQNGRARSAAAASRGEAQTRPAVIKEETRRLPSRRRRHRQGRRRR